MPNLQKEESSGGKGAASAAGGVQERVKDPKVRESVSATPPTKIIATVQSDLRGYIYGVQLVMCPFICMYISCRH